MEEPRRPPHAPDPVRPYVPPGGGETPAGGGSARHADGVSTLRPYLLTSGRVRPIDESLEIEAQVVATAQGLAHHEQLRFEHRDILALCAAPLSVAEVASRLGLHIGVSRVLVADLAALGYLAVVRPRAGVHRDVDTIERVIRGLESIR